MRVYDALVIGAGPAGSTAALLLARAGWRVAVVEKSRFPRRKVCGEFISATSLPLLRALHLADGCLADAGPQVRRIGMYAGPSIITAAMPPAGDGDDACAYGRALGREQLDGYLLQAALQTGAELWQPWRLAELKKSDGMFTGIAVTPGRLRKITLHARIVIAAHGSWEQGLLPTQVSPGPARASDLFAFKAEFHGSSLPRDLMPLLAFPGGYGGMVHTNGGRTGLSCCIRRDYLERCRRQGPAVRAVEAVIAHIRGACHGVEVALAGATPAGTWLAAGPIHPGIRAFRRDGLFAVGNAAGEAHPIVAEGISMAMQSAWLLCERLIARQDEGHSAKRLRVLAHEYAARWHGHFGLRLHAAAFFAHLAMRPGATRLAAAVVERVPAMLTLGAYLGGKARMPDTAPVK